MSVPSNTMCEPKFALPRPYVSLTGITTPEDVDIVVKHGQVFDARARHLLFAGFLVGPRSWEPKPRDRGKYLDLSSPTSMGQATEMVEDLRARGFHCIAHMCNIGFPSHACDIGWENDKDWLSVPWDGIQINANSLDQAELGAAAHDNCIHQFHGGLAKEYSYMMGFWRGLTGKGSRVLYDMSRGSGAKVHEENIREFVKMYVDFAGEGMHLGLAGGINGHSLEHVVETLRKYGFDPRNLSIDSESGVLRDQGGLDERNVQEYYWEAARLVAVRLDEITGVDAVEPVGVSG